MAHTYEVEVLADDGEPPDELRERFRICLERRLGLLESAGEPYPAPDAVIDILDAFEGPFVWEMTPEQIEATPPVGVELLVVAVEPAQPPDAPTTVKVIVRVPI